MNLYSITRPAVLVEPQTVLDPGRSLARGHAQLKNCRTIPSAYRLFLRESVRSFRATASVFPSSRFLSAALLEPIDFGTARIVIELGPGTGAITAEILRRLRPDACLYAVENNRHFIRHLGCCKDPRLTLVNASAEDLQSVISAHSIRLHQVDAIVSSLGLTTMSPKLRARILRQACACLAPGGTMTQYQYVTSRLRRFRAQEFLEDYFQDVSVRRVLFNLPPARVFACR